MAAVLYVLKSRYCKIKGTIAIWALKLSGPLEVLSFHLISFEVLLECPMMQGVRCIKLLQVPDYRPARNEMNRKLGST